MDNDRAEPRSTYWRSLDRDLGVKFKSTGFRLRGEASAYVGTWLRVRFRQRKPLPGERQSPYRTLQGLALTVHAPLLLTDRNIPACALRVSHSLLRPLLRFAVGPSWSHGDFPLAFLPEKGARADRGLCAIQIAAAHSAVLPLLPIEPRQPRPHLPLRESSEFSAALGLSREGHCPAASRSQEASLPRFPVGQQAEAVKLLHRGQECFEYFPVQLAPPVQAVGVWAPLRSSSWHELSPSTPQCDSGSKTDDGPSLSPSTRSVGSPGAGEARRMELLYVDPVAGRHRQRARAIRLCRKVAPPSHTRSLPVTSLSSTSV